MKLSDYLKDKIFSIIIIFLSLIFIIFLDYAFDINIILKVFIPSILFISYLIILIYDFTKRRIFYDKFEINFHDLKNKTLIQEIIKNPTFLDANIFLNYISDINKNFNDSINSYEIALNDFKDYLELWAHEIKTPIATSKLITLNNQNKVTESLNEEINKIDSYVEQIMYYARSENVEKDYFINKVNLKAVVNDVIFQNKKLILNKKIKINTFNNDVIVKSDAKWLKYILNQIIINSIKYSKDVNGEIQVSYEKNSNNIILNIEDNGIGINEKDLNKVFNKGFTGQNGRDKYNSTGMGLYLCKKLCNSLSHELYITSKENKYTKVIMVFPSSIMHDL